MSETITHSSLSSIDEKEEMKEEKKEEDTFVLIQIDDDNDKVGEFH